VLYCIIQNLVGLDRVYRPLVLGKRRVEKVRGAKRKRRIGGGGGFFSVAFWEGEADRVF